HRLAMNTRAATLSVTLRATLVAAGLLLPALCLAQAASPLSVPQLLRNLDSDNAKAAASAARTLGVVFAPGGRGGEDRDLVVTKLIEHLASQKSSEIRRQCAVALGEIRAAEAAEPMKQTLQDKEIEVVLAGAEAVAKILPVDAARNYLTEVGASEVSLAKVGAYHGLATIAKPEDAPFLLTGVDSPNWQAQRAAVQGLQRAVRAGAKLDEDQYKAVAGVLGADTVNAADAAIGFFTSTDNPGAVAALRDAADPEIHPDDWRMRTMALRAMYHRGWPRSRPELPLIVRNLGDKTANVDGEVWRMLNKWREDHHLHLSSQMPILVSELERAEPLARRGAIMGQMPSDMDAQYASRVAIVAAKTLTEAAEVEEAWPTQAQALRIIGATQYSGSIEEVCAAVNSNVGNVRSAAGTALERLGAACPAEQAAKVAPLLEPLLVRSVDWRKTSVAASAVGAYANEETLAPLVKLLAHDVLNVRQGASRSLELIAAGPSADLRAKLETLVYDELNQNTAAWEYGAPVLAALGDVKAAPLLTRMLGGADWRAQAAAGRAVQSLAQQHAIRDEALSRALVVASQSSVLQVQEACDLALRELAKRNEQAAAGEQ
ncbi:MAG: hypothetical protein KDA41_09730, partial [Planctomycetales bacterium]|nr:hypothetical protein [Planctomycetales bacterium]